MWINFTGPEVQRLKKILHKEMISSCNTNINNNINNDISININISNKLENCLPENADGE